MTDSIMNGLPIFAFRNFRGKSLERSVKPENINKIALGADYIFGDLVKHVVLSDSLCGPLRFDDVQDIQG